MAPAGARRRAGRGRRRARRRRAVRGLRHLVRRPHGADRRRAHRHHPPRAAPDRRPPEPAMTPTHKTGPLAAHPLRAPVLWGVVWGLIQAASQLAIWWLDQATVQALLLALIAAVYIGFAVADRRPTIVAVESTIA